MRLLYPRPTTDGPAIRFLPFATAPVLTKSEPGIANSGFSLLRQFESCEEITQLEARGVFGVGTMHRVLFDARCPFLADCTLVCLGRVGGAHQLAVIGNG